jgi:hypothetical protein
LVLPTRNQHQIKDETKPTTLNSANPTDPAPNAMTSLTEVLKELTTSLTQQQTVTNNRFLQIEKNHAKSFSKKKCKVGIEIEVPKIRDSQFL